MQGRSAYQVYLLITAATAFAAEMIFTVLAVYYVTVVGMNPFQLVFVGTVLEATIFLFEIPTGVVADTFSRRLSVIVGMFMLGGAFVLEGMLPFVLGVLLAEAIRGVGETFLSGALDAWLVDEVGEDRVGAVYLRGTQVRQVAGLLGIGASVAFASITLTLPILLGGAVYLVLGALLVLFMPETGFHPTPRGERSSWQAMGATLREGAQTARQAAIPRAFLGVSLIVGLSLEGFDRLWEAHFLTNFSFPALGSLQPVVWFGIIGVLTQLLNLAAAELSRRRLDTSGGAATGRAVIVLQACGVATIMLFGVAGSFPIALTALLATRVLGTIVGPLSTTWLVRHIDSRVRATVLSMSGLSNAFGQTVGGPAVGAVGTFFSIRAALVTSALLLSPILVLYRRVLRTGVASEDVAGGPAAAES